MEEKNTLIAQYKLHEKDTGSVNMQIALLTQRINELNGHLKNNPKDYASRTGLMKLVGRRRRFLSYLEDSNQKQYKELIDRLGLRA